MINFFKRKPRPKQQKQKVKQLSKDDLEWEVDTFLSKHPIAREIESRFAPLDRKTMHHPDEHIENIKTKIKAYYELKEYCYSQGVVGKEYFKITWQECHNSRNPKFDYIDLLKEQLDDYTRNYDNYLRRYREYKETR